MTPYQNQMLTKRFQAKHYLEENEKHQLSSLLNVSEKRITQWYLTKRFEEGIRLKGEECSTKSSKMKINIICNTV